MSDPSALAGLSVVDETKTNPVVSSLITWVDLETIRFTMGSNDRLGHADDDEGPVRDVTVGRMFVSAHPISVEAFRLFVAATDFVTEAERAGTGFTSIEGDRQLVDDLSWRTNDAGAVTQVSWTDAFEFCHWSNTRLATEAEWERLARSKELAASALDDGFEWTADYYDAEFHRSEQRVNPLRCCQTCRAATCGSALWHCDSASSRTLRSLAPAEVVDSDVLEPGPCGVVRVTDLELVDGTGIRHRHVAIGRRIGSRAGSNHRVETHDRIRRTGDDVTGAKRDSDAPVCAVEQDGVFPTVRTSIDIEEFEAWGHRLGEREDQ